MELLDSKRSIVVIVDLQGKLMEMIYRPKMVIDSTIRLLKLAELFEVPVIITEQYPKGLGTTHQDVWEVYEKLTIPKKHLEKDSFGCCGDPAFETAIMELTNIPANNRQIVIAGIEAHICVMQTVLALLKSNSQIHLCWECISGRGEEYRKHALERMQQSGVIVTNHESVGFEWAKDKNHPKFKDMSRLFKEGQP